MVVDHLEGVERDGRCRHRPHVYGSQYVHGVHRGTRYCHGHASATTWTKDVTVAEAAALVRALVDSTLSSASAN
ncbi:hypothetical protein [Streptomyces mirabilis]|uniref:hypothetical protein n=1 Tax=Streptomyces mirabilis TaxID=68239 RepID=UPI0036E9241B